MTERKTITPKRRKAGRPKGSKSEVTLSLHEIKRQMASSWERVDGRQIFDTLAREQPAVWASLVVKILPKETELSITHDDVANRVEALKRNPSADVHPQTETMLDACRQRLLPGQPITHEVVMAQVEEDQRKTNGKTAERSRLHTK